MGKIACIAFPLPRYAERDYMLKRDIKYSLLTHFLHVHYVSIKRPTAGYSGWSTYDIQPKLLRTDQSLIPNLTATHHHYLKTGPPTSDHQEVSF